MSDKPKKTNSKSSTAAAVAAAVAANKMKSAKASRMKRGRPKKDKTDAETATGSRPEEDDCVIVEPNIEVIDVNEQPNEVMRMAHENDFAHEPDDDENDEEDVVVTGTISPPLSPLLQNAVNDRSTRGRRKTKLRASSSNMSTNSNSSTSINLKRDKYGLGKRRSLRLIALGVK